jgi:hypothetical protein
MRELPLQYAWCRRVYDAEGVREPPLAPLLDEASHGICPDCAPLLLERERNRLRAAGELVRAQLIERRRLRLALAARRERNAQAMERSHALLGRAADVQARSRTLLHRRPPADALAT